MEMKSHVDVLGIEEQQDYHAAAYACIGKVEYRSEEHIASDQRHPLRPGPEREIEHVDHLTVQERGITLTYRYERGHMAQGVSINKTRP